MYSYKFSVSKRFSMPVRQNILYILPCSFSLTFTILLKNHVECNLLVLLSCRHLYASCWLSWDMFSVTKTFSENFKVKRFWNLVPRFLYLYVIDCFSLRHLTFFITLSERVLNYKVFCCSFYKRQTKYSGPSYASSPNRHNILREKFVVTTQIWINSPVRLSTKLNWALIWTKVEDFLWLILEETLKGILWILWKIIFSEAFYCFIFLIHAQVWLSTQSKYVGTQMSLF